jgi:hypothetical protein
VRGFDSSRGGYAQQNIRGMREPQDPDRGYAPSGIMGADRPRREYKK